MKINFNIFQNFICVQCPKKVWPRLQVPGIILPLSAISGPIFVQQKLPSSSEFSATSLLLFLARINGFIQQQTRGWKLIFKYLWAKKDKQTNFFYKQDKMNPKQKKLKAVKISGWMYAKFPALLIQHKSPGLPYGSPNFLVKIEFWACLCFSLEFLPFQNSKKLFFQSHNGYSLYMWHFWTYYVTSLSVPEVKKCVVSGCYEVTDIIIQLSIHQSNTFVVNYHSACKGYVYKLFAMRRKGEIPGMIAHVRVILSIQVATVFALKCCENLVWRSSQDFQNMLWSVRRLKDLVSLSHSNLYT